MRPLQIDIDLTLPYEHLMRFGNGILTYLLIYLSDFVHSAVRLTKPGENVHDPFPLLQTARSPH